MIRFGVSRASKLGIVPFYRCSSIRHFSIASTDFIQLKRTSAKEVFDLFDVDKSGYIEPNDIRTICTHLGEPISQTTANYIIDSIAEGRGISLHELENLWESLPLGTNDSGPVGEPISDENDLHFWRNFQHIVSRFIFLYAQASTAAQARVYTKETGTFPSLDWRLEYYSAGAPPEPDVTILNENLVAEIPGRKHTHLIPLNASQQDIEDLRETYSQTNQSSVELEQTIPEAGNDTNEFKLWSEGMGISTNANGVDPLEQALLLTCSKHDNVHIPAVTHTATKEELQQSSEQSNAQSSLWFRRGIYDEIDKTSRISTVQQRRISPWHDIPLMNSDGTLNMVVEIPKWSRAKIECATNEPYNPLKQDIKNGKLRNYDWGDMIGNYGFFPQTWENPNIPDHLTGIAGDNDPLDVVEIGQRCWSTGSVVRVKPIAALAMLDEGETDWKILAINVVDSMAHIISDLEDLQIHMPGYVQAIRRWFKLYKLPHVNDFAFNGEMQTRDTAVDVIQRTHEAWDQAIQNSR